MAIAVPLFAAVDNPFTGEAQDAAGDFTIFFVCIAAACLGIGALFGAWVARPLSPRLKERRRGVPVDRVLHGALTGIVATAIYLAICSIPPTTIAAVMAAYGPFWFFVANGLRIAGSMLGAAYQGRP